MSRRIYVASSWRNEAQPAPLSPEQVADLVQRAKAGDPTGRNAKHSRGQLARLESRRRRKADRLAALIRESRSWWP